MTGTTKLALLASIGFAIIGCGAKEDPDVSKPADKSAAVTKSGKVTKPGGGAIDPEQKAALEAEAKGK